MVVSISAAAGCGGAGGGSGGASGRDGARIYIDNCSVCHGPTAQGALGPNITFSSTAGIGSWTAAQFSTAVRGGVAPDGRDLCPDMIRYERSLLSDAEMTAVFDYLKTLADDTKKRGTLCP